jgi:hypothetical protein
MSILKTKAAVQAIEDFNAEAEAFNRAYIALAASRDRALEQAKAAGFGHRVADKDLAKLSLTYAAPGGDKGDPQDRAPDSLMDATPIARVAGEEDLTEIPPNLKREV